MKQKRFFSLILLSVFFLQTVAFAQTTAPAKAIYTAPKADLDKIMDEGMNRSQVMNHIGYLTDVIGPRLTNSPGMKRASEWTRDTMAKWGMQARLEPFGPWGRGWSLKSFSAQVVSPRSFPVIAYPNAWSPSTKGAVTSDVVYLDVKTDYLKYKGQLRGKIVLVGTSRELKAAFEAMGKRFDEAALAKMAEAPDPALVPDTRLAELFTPDGKPSKKFMDWLIGLNEQSKLVRFVFEEGAAVMIENSTRGSGGTLMVHNATVNQPVKPKGDTSPSKVITAWDKDAEKYMLPHITMATEDFNHLVRMINLGEKPTMTIDVQGQYQTEDLMAYNTIAEIPGTDPKLKDEIVMLGGHLDSWHASTGATDNATGCGVAMEAVRILLASGLKPRRTIRVALWSGEELGLFGSKAYVNQHFGIAKITQPNPMAKPPTPGSTEVTKGIDYDKLSVYYNLDNGTGKIRGIYMQGNSAVRPYFEEWLKPFHSLGAKTVTMSNTGATDHISFDQLGLPGFQFIQDSIEYESRTHHTNQDNFDRVQADDMKQASTIMAAFVYQSAMMDEKMPRKAVK